MEYGDHVADAGELVRARVDRGAEAVVQYILDHALDDPATQHRLLLGQTRLATTLLGLVAYHEQRPPQDVLDTVLGALAHADRSSADSESTTAPVVLRPAPLRPLP